MVVNEDDVLNIMGGMENAGGIKLNDHKRKLKNRFEICRKLGQGTYGKVQLGINKETGQQVAIKTIKKSKIETEADLIRIRREIQIMSSVQHPNIIHIYEVFENKEKMVLVMEIAAGGELYDYLSERKCLEEVEAKRIFRQIATAVYYCHKNNICHRDLKLENILLDENGNAKIADFGLSNVYDGKNLLTTFCGSPLYASPEIVRGSPYAGPEVDCWSLGVLLYTLVYGAMPFDGSNFKRLVKQITTGDYYEPKKPSAASSLIRTMLTVKSDKRANIGDICSHWWVNDGYPETCLEEAEYLASLTPVRLDLLLSLAPGNNDSKEPIDPRQTEAILDGIQLPDHTMEPAMSIVELPLGAEVACASTDSRVSISEPPDDESSQVKRRDKEKAKRKLTETPSMLDSDLVLKKRESDGTGTAIFKQNEDGMVMEEMPNQRRATSQSPGPGGKSSRPRKRKEENDPTRLGQVEDGASAVVGFPQISPDLPKKPPPKPKAKDVEHSLELQTDMKRRNSRRERNVKTPDPQIYSSGREDSRPMTPRAHPNERPMTPRQARAPSPEERPLVVPLPPPRVEQITLPPPRPPPRSESPAPPLPPRPRFDQEDQQIVIPLPPSVLVREIPEPPHLFPDERRSSKFILDDVVPQQMEIKPELPIKEHISVINQMANQNQQQQPPPLPEKKKARTPQLPDRPTTTTESKHHPMAVPEIPLNVSQNDPPGGVKNTELNLQPDSFQIPLIRPDVEEEIKEHPPIKASLFAIQTAKIESIQVPSQNLTDFSEDMLLSVPQLIGKVTIESHHEPREVVVTQAMTSFNAPVQNIEPQPLHVQAQAESHHDDQEAPQLEVSKAPVKEVSVGPTPPQPVLTEQHTTTVEVTPLQERIHFEPLKIVTSSFDSNQTKPQGNGESLLQPVHSESPSREDTLSNRSLINSIPKPYKPEVPTDSNSSSEQIPTKGQQHSESARSCSSLSSSESNQSLSRKQSLQTQQSYNDDISSLSPGSSSLPRPEKRDSKVIKAAQYWNNYIGEVLVKNKPPENPKSLEKPKKIVSAGVGQKGYNDLKNTFEQGGNIQRRNSKKMTLDSCLPGLRVTDAKSAFEKKNQPPTPVIYRKNSATTDGLKEKPKWVRPVKAENEPEFPFSNKQSSDLKSRIKAKVSSDNESEPDRDKPIMNGLQKNNLDEKCMSNGTSLKDPDKSPERQKQEWVDPIKPVSAVKSGERSAETATARQVKTVNSTLSPKLDKKLEPLKISSPKVKPKDEGKGSEKSHETKTKLDSSSEIIQKVDAGSRSPVEVGDTQAVLDGSSSKGPEDGKRLATPILIKEPHTFVAKPAPKEETVKKLKSGVVVIVNNRVRSQPVVINNSKPVLSTAVTAVLPDNGSPKLVSKTPPVTDHIDASSSPESSPEKQSTPTPKPDVTTEKDIHIEVAVPLPKAPVPREESPRSRDEEKTPVPEPGPTENVNHLEAVKNSLKKVPHAPAMRRRSMESPPMTDQPQGPALHSRLSPVKTVAQCKSNGERVIPIKIEQESSPCRREHYIPIVVEGRGTPLLKTPDPSLTYLDNHDDGERLDLFSSDSLSRRRWGSRKKRLSSAYSDTASVSTATTATTATTDDDLKESAFSGLQKYTSIGKHGMDEAPMFRLRKTRPPFALQRDESCSSGEDDVFNDDGFREMTAENLFSTLLTRVKSLTRRINDEHEDPLLSSALRWQQNKRIINHPLNPGGTHARLERSALRSSLKRSGPPSSVASTAPSLSRQSSTDASRLSSYSRLDDDQGSQYRGMMASEAGQLAKESAAAAAAAAAVGGYHESPLQSQSPHEYNDSQISVTSKQRLRPGYLPPPQFNSPMAPTSTSTSTSTTQSNNTYFHNINKIGIGKGVGIDTSVVAAGYDRGGAGAGGGSGSGEQQHLERTIPITLLARPVSEAATSRPQSATDLREQSASASRYPRPASSLNEESIYARREMSPPTRPMAMTRVVNIELDQEHLKGPSSTSPCQSPAAEGTGTSYNTHQSMSGSNSKRPLDNRKLSYELRSNELDIINKLRREAAERSNELMGEVFDGELDMMDDLGERLMKKRGGFLSRLDEDETYLSPSRHLTRRSISRELFGGNNANGTDFERPSSLLSGGSSTSASRPVTRRSISRELFDYLPTSSSSLTGRITPTLNLGVSSARRPLTSDYTRSSRERSLGRDNPEFDRQSLERNRPVPNRRSESLTRGHSGALSPTSQISSMSTSRPTLASQGRSLTQNEFLRSSPRTTASGRLSAGIEDESSRIRSSGLTDRGRSDWRRVSVPERGKDYSTIQSKYKRYSSVMDDTSSSYADNMPLGIPLISRGLSYSQIQPSRPSYLSTGNNTSFYSPLRQSYSSSRVGNGNGNGNCNSGGAKYNRLSRHYSFDDDPSDSYHPSGSSSYMSPESYVTMTRRRRLPETSQSVVDKYFSPSASSSSLSRQPSLDTYDQIRGVRAPSLSKSSSSNSAISMTR